ncbi:TPA: hypothetical protein PXO57_003867 [Yersinia enterocolitica]|nr:hypothetical protein [Yersinia enterocolitica]HDL7593393.1 hypothetical protein [Yersinia enterocolitica]
MTAAEIKHIKKKRKKPLKITQDSVDYIEGGYYQRDFANIPHMGWLYFNRREQYQLNEYQRDIFVPVHE